MKRLIFAVLAFLILVIGAIFIFSRQSVNYLVDSLNRCTWENGKITENTLVPRDLKTVVIKKSDEINFLNDAQLNSKCVFKK